MSLFEDRIQAGRELSNFLKDKTTVDLVVIPYIEAFEIGMEIAKENNAEIKIILSDFISAPDIPYGEIGAAAEDGTIWVEDRLVDELEVSRLHIEQKAEALSTSLGEQSITLKPGFNPNKRIIIASEGLGSGFREAAVAGSLLKKGFQKINIATPFKSENVMADIEEVADELFYVKEVPFLSSPNSFYKQDEENIEIAESKVKTLK